MLNDSFNVFSNCTLCGKMSPFIFYQMVRCSYHNCTLPPPPLLMHCTGIISQAGLNMSIWPHPAPPAPLTTANGAAGKKYWENGKTNYRPTKQRSPYTQNMIIQPHLSSKILQYNFLCWMNKKLVNSDRHNIVQDCFKNIEISPKKSALHILKIWSLHFY